MIFLKRTHICIHTFPMHDFGKDILKDKKIEIKMYENQNYKELAVYTNVFLYLGSKLQDVKSGFSFGVSEKGLKQVFNERARSCNMFLKSH